MPGHLLRHPRDRFLSQAVSRTGRISLLFSCGPASALPRPSGAASRRGPSNRSSSRGRSLQAISSRRTGRTGSPAAMAALPSGACRRWGRRPAGPCRRTRLYCPWSCSVASRSHPVTPIATSPPAARSRILRASRALARNHPLRALAEREARSARARGPVSRRHRGGRGRPGQLHQCRLRHRLGLRGRHSERVRRVADVIRLRRRHRRRRRGHGSLRGGFRRDGLLGRRQVRCC